MSQRYTRQQFLGAAGAGAIGFVLLGLTACESAESSDSSSGEARISGSPPRDGVYHFRSRPDLIMPEVRVLQSSAGAASGYLIVAAKNGFDGEDHPSLHGPMIMDGEDPVWLRPIEKEGVDAMDFRVQSYRGEPVLTWWEGTHAGWGEGEYIILDSSYREAARFGAAGGYAGDHHEFLITDRDTALIGIYGEVAADLSPVGGPPNGRVMEGIVQEIDIESGELLFEWHSLDHVGFDESQYDIPPDYEDAFDYFHINSIDVDSDGNLLVSARRTSAVYKIDRDSGEVIWRLGGRNSDFELGEGARFYYQHDARRQPEGAITLFDNRGEEMNEPSRGVALDLDEETMQATLAREYVHPENLFGIYQGSMQRLPNGNFFIGWGSDPHLSEFSRGGELLFDARFPSAVESYRSYRSSWRGFPEESPALAVERGDGEEVTVYASYNGATEVANWEVLAGPGPEDLRTVNTFRRKGFETAMTVRTEEPHLGVRAKNDAGEMLGEAEMGENESPPR